MVQPIAVCLYVQILLLAQSADTQYEFVEASVCFIAVSYIVCCSKLHSLLTGIKDNFHEFFFFCEFWAFWFFGGGVGFLWFVF